MLALDRNGIPIGQVLLPGRKPGHNLAPPAWPLTRQKRGGKGCRLLDLNNGTPPQTTQRLAA